MFLAIVPATRRAMESTGGLVSNWYNRGDYPPCTHSGELATMRRRNNRLKFLTLTGAVCFFLPVFALAQPQAKTEQPPDAGDAVFSTETRLVPLNVTVTDKAGHLVTNLPQSAFQIFENGLPQQIKLFKREDVPVSMGLI